MARAVYAQRKNYKNVQNLKDAIEEARAPAGSDRVPKLCKSLPRCIYAVLDAYGGGKK